MVTSLSTVEIPSARALRRAAIGAFLALVTVGASAGTVESETLMHLDKLRAVTTGADKKTTEQYNNQMNSAWTFFNANKKAALPTLRSQLSLELEMSQPNPLLLLDVGYFLYQQETVSDKSLAKRALFRLDPAAEIVRWNQQELFDFAHAVASDRDSRILDLIDKAFLKEKVSLYVPQHALTLDETLVCVFLYGAYGSDSETHLKALLRDHKLTPKIIEILAWIGSPDSDQDVKTAMQASRDYETFARATAFMMKLGGPQGRAIMLRVDPKELDTKSQEYYGKIRKQVEAASYESLRGQFAGLPGHAKIDNEALKKRLSAMYANYGKDDETSPMDILDSSLPGDFLISELTRIRSRSFQRVSDEALSDVEMTNALLNTLRYRGK
jgi:hypothetical protein